LRASKNHINIEAMAADEVLSSGADHERDRRLVLVVEDDPETRHLLVDALSHHGFRTEGAHNGLQALEKAFACSPDLVLADIAVPGIDGIELCRRLRADGRTRDVPVLAITGYDDRQYQDRAIDAGADRVLQKPCEPEALIQAVRELVVSRTPSPSSR
jgi:CheY-like chemotaxis protein